MENIYAPTEQRATLKAQEQRVAEVRGDLLRSFYRYGMALHALKEGRLWLRFRSATWERYCVDYLHCKRANADRIIQAALIVDGMLEQSIDMDGNLLVPDAITHALALGKLPDAQRLKTWQIIMDVSNEMILPASGVTAGAIKSIAEVAEELLVTGAVTQSDGEQVEFKTAIRQAAVQILADSAAGYHQERGARAAAHRQNGRAYLINEEVDAPPDGTITLTVPPGARIAIRAWIIEANHGETS